MIFISILIIYLSPGKVIYWSERVGKKNKNFFMPKFRTMVENTPEVATDKLKNPSEYITNFEINFILMIQAESIKLCI